MPPLSAGAVSEALALRSSYATGELQTAAHDVLDMEGLSFEDRQLVTYRMCGSMATRIAIGSLYMHASNPETPDFLSLTECTRQDVLTTSVQLFGENLRRTATENGMDTQQILGESRRHAALVHAADPVKVPHKAVRNQLFQARQSGKPRSHTFDMYKKYINVTSGTFPGDMEFDPPLGEHDAVLVQAFGRNTVKDKDLPEINRILKDEAGGDDQKMWERLAAMDFDPGVSNAALAKVVRSIMDSQLPIEGAIQWEVAYEQWRQDPEFYRRHHNYFHTLWPKTGSYRTYEVKRDSAEIMDAIGLYNPLELAHSDMVVRSIGILGKLGVAADPLIADIPFDKSSVQYQIRGPRQWVLRESLTRVEHLVRGRVKF